MITEQLLLNHGGATQLDRIQTLNLADLKITTKDLVAAQNLFDELTSLDELDLSNNNIREMPSLALAECRVLNLSGNNISNVDFLDDHWTIEDIDLRNNGEIDIIERMKIRIYLPRVRTINGEFIEDRDLALSILSQLKNRLMKLYMDQYQYSFHQLRSTSVLEFIEEEQKPEEKELRHDFVEKAKKVPAGPGSFRKFRVWLAERIVSDIIEDDNKVKIEDEVSFYRKMKKKRKMNSDPYLDEWTSPYFPICALQCHSNNVNDDKVQVWNLAFEPVVGKNNMTTSLIASAGADSVCFIDVKSGKVLAKYVRKDEEFFSVAWSYSSHRLAQEDTFVAVGGMHGYIYLISPSSGICLHKWKVSRKHKVNVNTMQFCYPIRPNLMFAAVAGNDIFELTGWLVTEQKSTKMIQLLGIDSTPIRILVPNTNELLRDVLCATETGLKVWSIEDLDPNRKETRELKGSLQHPKIPEENQVDGIAQLTDDILVSKCSNSGVIFIWRHKDMLSELKNPLIWTVIEPLKIFNWSNTNELYINVNSSIPNQMFFGGDEKGRIWFYKPDFDGPEMQDADEVIPWPHVNREHGLPLLQTTIINDVIMTSDGRFIAVGTNNNLVVIFRKTN